MPDVIARNCLFFFTKSEISQKETMFIKQTVLKLEDSI